MTHLRIYPYGTAVISVGVALLLMLLLEPVAMLTRVPFLLFFGAVVVSAWQGGMIAGLVATALSVLIGFLLAEGLQHPPILGLQQGLQTGTFILEGVLVSTLCGSLRSTNRHLDRSLLELKLNEASLQQASQRVTEFLESITDGFYSLNFQGQFVYINNQAEAVLGRSRQELIGQAIWDVFPQERGSLFDQAFQRAIHEQTPTLFEVYGVIHPERWFEVRITPLSEGLAVFFQDITDRKQAEQEIQSLNCKLERRVDELQTLLNVIPIGISIAEDPECRVIRANPFFQKIFNITPDVNLSVTHAGANSVACRRLRQGRELAPEELPMQVAATQGIEVRNTEIQIIRPDGAVFDLLGSATPLRDDQGQVRGSVAVFMDISDRKRDERERRQTEEALRLSEDRYRTLANAVSTLMWINDAEGNIQFFNQRWQEYTGKSLELGVGLWREIIHPDDFQPTFEKRKKAIDAEVAYEIECRLQRYDQTYRWHLARIVPLKDEAGRLLQWYGTATDIHDVKLTETALRASEAIAKARAEELETFMETVPAAVWIAHDPQCHRMTANRTAYQLLGLPLGAVPTATPEDGNYPFPFEIQKEGRVIPLDDLLMQQVGRTGEEAEAEFDFVFETGEVRSVWGRAVPLRNEAGEIRGVIGAFLDVSDRKRTEAELRQREQRFSTLFNGMEDWVLVYPITADHQPGKFIEVNEQACRKLGYSREELLQMSVNDIVGSPLIDPLENIERLLAERLIIIESVHTTKDGRCIPCEVSATLFMLNGLPTIQSICRDITERQQAEEALRQSELDFRTLANSMPQIFWTAQSDGTVNYYNQRWYDYTGLTLEQTKNQEWTRILHPDDVQPCLDRWNESVQSGKNYEIEYRFLDRSNQRYRWHLGRAFPLRNDNGQIIKWFGSSTDIHDQKTALEERDQALNRERTARQEAEAANRIKDEFLAVLSHELRSPLNPILGWTKLLQTRKFDEAATKQALQTIERNAKLQTQLIEDLLDVSRILRGKMALNIAPVNLVTTIEAALETVRLAAEAKGLQIQTTLSAEGGWVMGDANRLQQIVWNLLSNAVKFTPAAGRIEIRLEQVGSLAQIQVQDTGKGISAAFLPYIFESFRQEDGRITRQFGGLGLGLAIVRHLTELHGGTIQAESLGEGLGATFTVKLPLLLSTSDQPANQPREAQLLSLDQVKILVVDDEVDMRDLMLTILQAYGAEVRVAASAAETLFILKQFQPHVLISDIGMPQVDGYHLMWQIRQLPPDQGGRLPSIALTAYASEFDQKQALNAGFQLHLPKPVEPETLVKAVIKLIRPSFP